MPPPRQDGSFRPPWWYSAERRWCSTWVSRSWTLDDRRPLLRFFRGRGAYLKVFLRRFSNVALLLVRQFFFFLLGWGKIAPPPNYEIDLSASVRHAFTVQSGVDNFNQAENILSLNLRIFYYFLRINVLHIKKYKQNIAFVWPLRSNTILTF